MREEEIMKGNEKLSSKNTATEKLPPKKLRELGKEI